MGKKLSEIGENDKKSWKRATNDETIAKKSQKKTIKISWKIEKQVKNCWKTKKIAKNW